MFITPDNLNIINLEFTDYCNAACPMCARFKTDGSLYREKVNQNHTTLATLQKRIPEKIIKQLKKVHSIGTYGDPAMAPECADIYRWIKELNPECKFEMHSNGGARNTDFWKTCAELGIVVMFGIDGLEDTNHLYRRNVKWDKLMANVKAFIGAGGEAEWEFLVFKHNQQQIVKANELSKELGFKRFKSSFSERWQDFNSEGEYRDIDTLKVDDYVLEKPIAQEKKYIKASSDGDLTKSKNVFKFQEENEFLTRKISCWACTDKKREIYLRANGYVSPCCILGDVERNEPKGIIEDFKKINLHHTDLKDILEGDFFKDISEGIGGGEKRLQGCYHACGIK